MQLRRRPSDDSATESATAAAKSADEQAADTAQASHPDTQAKGRPTPKRKDAEAANRRPIVVKNRKAAGKSARERERAERNREYEAMKVGDVAHYPYNERGPIKAYIRDYVDARWNLGEYFLISAIVLLVVSVATTRWPAVAFGAMAAVYVYGILAIGDTIVMWVLLKRRLKAKFGEAKVLSERGLGLYAGSRALQFRRWRMPRPLHPKHGVYPE